MPEINEQNFLHEVREFHKRDGGGKTTPSKSYTMIRPDRPFDKPAHRYPDDDSRRKGDEAMKAWFEYLAAKKFVKTLLSWRAMLKSGQSIMVVCADPLAFDLAYAPPEKPVLAADFWVRFERERLPVDSQHWDEAERQRVLELIASLRIQLQSMRDVSRKPAPKAREWQSTPLSEIDPSKPLPQLSDKARARL